ncbi:unnamed protein product [Rhodiola kirilowii]
MFQVDAQF